MSDYGSLYLIETNYNSERDATEVIFGYMEKEKKIAGRIMSIREKGLIQARGLLERSSKAIYEED